MRVLTLTLTCLAMSAAPLWGQAHEHGDSPYAGHDSSGIASLSSDELHDLRTGAGMGLARAAELNHYPGPLHALEWADSLRLTAGQHARILAIRQLVLHDAIAVGERIIQAEEALSRRFAHAHIDSTSLADATAELGRLYGELRFVHLAAHLAMKQLMTPEQVAAYDRLRGYAQQHE